MVRPAHPRRLEAMIPVACRTTNDVYREYPDRQGCPDYLEDPENHAHGCCTFDTRSRNYRDISFLHLIRNVLRYRVDSISYAQPFSPNFTDWLADIPNSIFDGMDRTRPSVVLTDDRFDMIKAFIGKMAPSHLFVLEVNVPSGHHVFRFPDNFAGKTVYRGPGSATLDVSDAAHDILKNRMSFMRKARDSALALHTQGLVPVIRNGLGLPQVLKLVVQAAAYVTNPFSRSRLIFREGNVAAADIPPTHHRLKPESLPSATREAHELAAALQSIGAWSAAVENSHDTVYVRATTHQHVVDSEQNRVWQQVSVKLWPSVALELFIPDFTDTLASTSSM